MNMATPTRRRMKPSEEGYILVAVMFMLAILIIAMAVAAPRIAKEIQRDREVETMRRGKQYARAVKLYYKKFNAYPPNQDALVKTNEIRFLRRKYLDPMTGKDDWKPIAVGQNKAPTAFGFFGVPLTGAGMGGGLCGNALPSSTSSSTSSIGGSAFSSGGSGSGFGSGGSFGASSPTSGCPSTTTGGSVPAGTGAGTSATTDPNAANGSTDPNAATGSSPTASDSSSGSNSSSGSSSSPGVGTANGAANSASASGTSTAAGTGLTGQTFGGAGIMGFSPGSTKQSILVYKKKNRYNEWEFVYDPLADQMMMQGGNTGTIGTPAGSMPGSSPIGGGSTIGGGTTSGGFGSTGGTGSGGTTPSPQPQQ
jgi:type II secretory pathway pseudopilin PulG